MPAGVSLLGTRVDVSESSPWRNWETVLAPDRQGCGLHSFLHPNLSGNQTQLSPFLSWKSNANISPDNHRDVTQKSKKAGPPNQVASGRGFAMLQCHSGRDDSSSPCREPETRAPICPSACSDGVRDGSGALRGYSSGFPEHSRIQGWLNHRRPSSHAL